MRLAKIGDVRATMTDAAALFIGNNNSTQCRTCVFDVEEMVVCTVSDQSNMDPQQRADQLWLYSGSEINPKLKFSPPATVAADKITSWPLHQRKKT